MPFDFDITQESARYLALQEEMQELEQVIKSKISPTWERLAEAKNIEGLVALRRALPRDFILKIFISDTIRQIQAEIEEN